MVEEDKKNIQWIFLVLAGVTLGGAFLWQGAYLTPEAPPDASTLSHVVGEITNPELGLHPRLQGLAEWQRPEGPPRVALQVGHWKASEAPEEQINLRNTTGTRGGGHDEWEVNMAIAEEAKKILEAEGVVVELLPTTIPPNYWADVFVSIHADGNADSRISGYKAAASRLDQTGKAEALAQSLEEAYESATNLKKDPNVTRSMRGYYAFNWRRYNHSLHPLTTAAILEAGFLTSPNDRRILVGSPERAALGLAQGVIKFLEIEKISS